MPDNNELVNVLRSVIHEELKPVHQELQELRQGQDRLESKVDKLELRMDNEVIEKINALFDVGEVTNDNFVKVMEKLDSIEIDTCYLVSRVAHLEEMVR